MKLKVYRFEFVDKGDSFMATPSVPEFTSEYEDSSTERICVCPYILGCIRALEIPESIIVDKDGLDNKILHLYSASVNEQDLQLGFHQPSESEVPDVWITGEMWLLQPTKFVKEAEYTISKQFDLPNSVYSRFQVAKTYPNGYSYELPPDRVVAPVIYGDSNAFSFIAMDPRRKDEAIEYAEKYPYIP